MTPRRLLFIAPSAYALSGLAVWLDYLLPGLRGTGWDAVLGLVSGPRFHRPSEYLAAHSCADWLPIHSETCTPEGRRRAVLRAIGEVSPDVVVVVNIPDTYGAIAHVRRRQARTPKVVMSLHGIQGDLLRDGRRYRDALDAVIATNRLAAALAVEIAGVSRSRVLYAPYGVSLPLAGGVDGPRCASRPLRIVYSGRLEQEQKRIRDLPAILQALDANGVTWQLCIAGSGPEEGWLRDHLEGPLRAGQVVFLGHVPTDRMAAEVYAHADALLLTSAWETGPLVVWEAMAHGVPVVSSAYVGSGLEDSLDDGHNSLLFTVGDTRGATAALTRLAHDEALSETLRANGRLLVRERYSIGASVVAWDRALRAVVDLPDLGPPLAPPSTCPAGRLDRWLGHRFAETLRVLTRRRGVAVEAGDEWPHSHSALSRDEDAVFWQTAAQLDRGIGSDRSGPAIG